MLCGQVVVLSSRNIFTTNADNMLLRRNIYALACITTLFLCRFGEIFCDKNQKKVQWTFFLRFVATAMFCIDFLYNTLALADDDKYLMFLF